MFRFLDIWWLHCPILLNASGELAVLSRKLLARWWRDLVETIEDLFAEDVIGVFERFALLRS
jgi:hypothetical protein